VRLGRDRLVQRRRLGPVLCFHLRLALSDPSAPGVRALDRAPEVVAGQVERRELEVGAEDRHGHGAVGVVSQVVLVEVDAVGLGAELQALGGALARQVDLDQALTLVRVDSALVLALRRSGTGGRQRACRNSGKRSPHGSEAHAEFPPC
jgi:hypothetical protein